MRCFARSKLSRSLVHLKIFGFDMTSSFQVRILILSREVEHLFWVWINSEKSLKQQLFSVNYETSHNLTYSFLELFVFFWITFEFISHYQKNTISKYILQGEPVMKQKQRAKIYTFLLASDTCFSFMNKFS